MRLLIIDEEFPFPLNTGKRIRSFSLTKALTDHCEVSYLAYGNENSESFQHLELNGIKCHAVPPPDLRQNGVRFYIRLLGNLFSRLPYIVSSHYTSRFKQILRELVAENRYDLIICEWTPYAIYLKNLKGPKSIVVAHNIETSIWRRYLENENNLFKKAYIAIQRAKVERFEQSCFNWANGATAVCEAETQEITGFGVNYTVQTVENGVNTDYFQPANAEVGPSTLVFTGSMDWRPNMDAIEYFVSDILPLAKRQRPDLQIFVVGRKPPKHIRDLGLIDGVTITGTVDDVRPYIAEAALYVVPLRIGGGSRLKILEAMAMQKPVLSTTVGAEGLNVTSDDNIVISDGAEKFADDIVRLLDDPQLRERIAANGRSTVEQHYRWESLGEKLYQYIRKTASAP